MKLKKLTMQAFGSYVKETIIDFGAINGLFLISGPTGSGKTTIFDAICYALYGQSSGQYSGKDKLRSDAALPKDETYVKLEFVHQGKDYVVERSPEYSRLKDRGEGTTTQKAKATLWEGKEVVADLPTKVDKEIKALIGIDAAKFKQIALIAQGEFSKLLNINTAEREEILRTLFMTEQYQAFESKLYEKKNEVTKKKNDQGFAILQTFSDIHVDEEDCGADLLERIGLVRQQKNDPSCDYLDELIDEIVAVDKDKLKKVRDDYSPAQIGLEKKIAALSDAENNNKIVKEYEDALQAYRKLALEEESFKKREADLQNIKNATYEIKPLYDKASSTKKEIVDLKQQMKTSHDRATENQSKYEGLQKKRDAYQEDHEQKLLDLQSRITLIENDKEKYEERDSLKKEVQENSLRLKIIDVLIGKCKIGERSRKLSSLGGEIKTAQGKYKDLLKAQDDLQKAQREFDEHKQVYDQSCRLLENSRAGILAEQLKEGKPCLVCGSLDHPHPAKKAHDAPTEAEVEEQKDMLESLRTKKDESVVEASDKKSELVSCMTNVRHSAISALQELRDYYEIEEIDDVKEYAEGEDVQAWFDELKSNIQICHKCLLEDNEAKRVLYDDLTACESGKNIAQEIIDSIKNDKETERQIEALEEDQKMTDSLREQQRGTLNAYETLPYSDWSAAKKVYEAALKEKQSIDNEIKEMDKDLEDLKEKTATLKGEVESSKSQIRKKEKDLEDQKEKLKNMLVKYEFDEEAKAQAYFKGTDEIEIEQDEIAGYWNNFTAAKKMMEASKDKAKDIKIVDIEELKLEKERAQEIVDKLSKQKSDLETRITFNVNKKKHIDELRGEYDKTKNHAVIYEKLHRLVSGAGSLSLEHYVQASGFDEIVENANRRFMAMTNGQYKLCRKTESSDKRSQEFLNLEAYDIMKGTKRGVGSLSGGESFLAALSLALGMSDTISTHQGGISTDFLFIDEGFGTLDSDTVESVIGALTSLSEDKLVGVISHREELKQNIEQRIDVEKTPKGSVVITPF